MQGADRDQDMQVHVPRPRLFLFSHFPVADVRKYSDMSRRRSGAFAARYPQWKSYWHLYCGVGATVGWKVPCVGDSVGILVGAGVAYGSVGAAVGSGRPVGNCVGINSVGSFVGCVGARVGLMVGSVWRRRRMRTKVGE